MKFLSYFLLLACIIFLDTTTTGEAANFTCNANANATCQSLIGYVPPNSTTLSALAALFNVSPFSSLLGANNLPLSTPPTKSAPANSTVNIPFPCLCTNGTGQSDHIPTYVVQPQDGLDAIARNVFDGFVTYQEIAAVNNISDANSIQVGQQLWIPLPCSCDPVGGGKVVHYGYRVAPGNTVAWIAQEFGTTQSTLLELNGMNNPNALQADQILDVPLRACQSYISNTSADYNMLLPKGTYALTAGNCVQCSCSADTYQLDCISVEGQRNRTCPVPTCNNGTLHLGNTSTSGCTVTTCAYAGYTNSTTNVTITAIAVANQTNCSGARSGKLGFTGSIWRISFIFLHTILIWISFL